MKQSTPINTRNKLKNKIATAFKNDIKSLSPEYRKIIVDDLVSAFQSRLSVLSRAQSHINFAMAVEGEIQVEA